MRTPAEIAAHSLALAHRATDDLAQYIGALPSDTDDAPDLLFEAGKILHGDRSPRRTPPTRETWEAHAAGEVLMAVGYVLRLHEPDDDEDPEEDAWEALRAADVAGARRAAARMFELAEDIEEDDWNYGNLTHWGHIILGHAHLMEDNIAGAAAELKAAGNNRGSPQLDSFGPDLQLAWTLLKLGADDAVV